MARLRCVGYNPLLKYIQRLVQDSSVSWHRGLFLAFVQLVRSRTTHHPKATISSNWRSASAGTKKRPSFSERPPLSSCKVGDSLSLAQYLNTADAHFKILSQLVLPCVQHSLEKSPGDFVLPGGTAKPAEENSKR